MDSNAPTLVVRQAATASIEALLDPGAPPLSILDIEAALPAGAAAVLPFPLPVLMWGEGTAGTAFASQTDPRTIVVDVDVIASTLFMLTRHEEKLSSQRDDHGRFPSSASVAARLGFLDRPLLDEYAVVVREWLRVLIPGWTPALRRFTVCPTHDVDTLFPFRTFSSAFRSFGGELFKRGGGVGEGVRLFRTALLEAAAPEKSVNLAGLYELATLSRRLNLPGAFYFMARRAPIDSDYDLDEPLVRDCIRRLEADGFEIGLHPSYSTVGDLEQLKREKAALDTLVRQEHCGGRQHFLRFRVPDTWLAWEAAGLSYDCTLGYADREGFRCGTCHPFRPFDVQGDRELSLWEIPLVVMDVTLRNYRRYSPEEAEERMLRLARYCQLVGGKFTILWHNSSLAGTWAPWAAAYRRVLEACGNAMAGEPRPIPISTVRTQSLNA